VSFELFPVSGNLIPIHTLLLLMKNLLVGSRPCPGGVQIDHEQIPSVSKKLRFSAVLVNEGAAAMFKEYQSGGKNQE
jgi:hypothetical protein